MHDLGILIVILMVIVIIKMRVIATILNCLKLQGLLYVIQDVSINSRLSVDPFLEAPSSLCNEFSWPTTWESNKGFRKKSTVDMISKTPPFMDLNIRIPILFPIKGRGFIDHGSGLVSYLTRTPKAKKVKHWGSSGTRTGMGRRPR